jgi:photosystem II stability/assembly factor-like uncharacterized protein
MKDLLPVALIITIVLSGCAIPGSQGQTTKPVRTPLGSTPTQTQTVEGPSRLTALQRLNPKIGYIAGWTETGGGLAKTADNGVSWQRLTDPAASISAVRFIDERVGWVTGFAFRDVAQVACHQAAPTGTQPCRGVVLRTHDGGRSWQTVLAIPTNGVLGQEVIRQFQAVDGERAWAVTLDESSCSTTCPTDLRRTTDSGKTWTSVFHGPIAAIRFASASRGWIALDDTPTMGTVQVRETSDGGSTWTTVLETKTGNTMGLDAATVNTAWLVTRDGGYCTASNCEKYALFRTDNGGSNWWTMGNPKDIARRCSGGNLGGPLFASATRGWLGLNLGGGGANVGPGGILKSEDGGWTWQCSTSPPNINLISAADPLHAWAAGEDRAIQSTALYTTEDGGASWHRVDLSSVQ